MLKRVITAVALLAIAFLMIYLRGWPLRITWLVVMGISLMEVFKAFEARGAKPVKWPGYFFCAAVFMARAFAAETAFMGEPVLIALVACAMLGMICVILKGRPDFDAIVATVFPMLYPGLFFACLMGLQDLSGRTTAVLSLLLTIVMSSMNDTFALFVGRACGKRKLIPGISPHKTVAGAVAGLVASAAFAAAIPLIVRFADEGINGVSGADAFIPVWIYVIFGLVAGAISQLGDLMASLLKRWCGIKDYGKIFPGHGGMMDRLDAILFNGTACYIFFLLAGR